MRDRRNIPKPPYWRRTETRILDEAAEALGLVLWQYVRHVRDWVDTPVERRTALFNPAPPRWVLAKRAEARAEAPQLADALDRLARLTAAPLSVDVHQLAEACQQIAVWAVDMESSEIALQFAEAAALVDAGKPRRANLAGRINRQRAEYPRAEEWFDRGIKLARQRRDSVERARGHIGLGILHQTLGRDSRARKHFNTASVIAMRDGREWLAAEAQHDLMLMAAERGRYDEAEEHARKALRWYPKNHERFPFFVADLAFLLVCERSYRAAAGLLEQFLRVITDPAKQVLGLSLFVRALGAAGDRSRFDRMRRRLLRLLARHRAYEPAARINLAEGERAAGMWNEAEANARLALELARARRDTVPETLAGVLLDDLAGRRPAPGEDARSAEPAFTALLDAASTRLAGWTPTRRGQRPRSLGREDWAVA